MDYDLSARRSLLGWTLLAVCGVAAILTWPFLPALLWASVLSILTFPLQVWFRQKLSRFPAALRDNLAPTLTVLTTVLVFALPALVVTIVVMSQMDRWAEQDSLHSVVVSLQSTFKSIGSGQLAAYVEQNREELIRSARTLVLRTGAGIGQAGLQVVFALLTQFFMLRDGERLREPFLRLAPLERSMGERLLARVTQTTRAVFVGTVIVAIVQGTLTGAILGLAGVPYAALLGALATLCAIVPLVGAPFVYVPAGIWLIVDGRLPAALWVLGGGFLIVSQIDNVIKPFLIGNRTGLHPIAVFFAILGGLVAFGPIGVMAGPMVLSIVLVLLEAWGTPQELVVDSGPEPGKSPKKPASNTMI